MKTKSIIILMVLSIVILSASCKKEQNTYRVAFHPIGYASVVYDNTFWFPITPGAQFESFKDSLLPAYIQYLTTGKDYICGKWIAISLDHYLIVDSNPNCPNPIHACMCVFKVKLKKIYSASTHSMVEASSEAEALEWVKNQESTADSIWVVHDGDHTNQHQWDYNNPQCY